MAQPRSVAGLDGLATTSLTKTCRNNMLLIVLCGDSHRRLLGSPSDNYFTAERAIRQWFRLELWTLVLSDSRPPNPGVRMGSAKRRDHVEQGND